MLHVYSYAHAAPRWHVCPRVSCTQEQRSADFCLRMEFKSAAVTPSQWEDWLCFFFVSFWKMRLQQETIRPHDLCHSGHLGLLKTLLADAWTVDVRSIGIMHIFLFLSCLTSCAISIMPNRLWISSFSSGSSRFSCKVMWCSPTFHTQPCRSWLEHLVGTNYTGTHAIFCHLLFFGFFCGMKVKSNFSPFFKAQKKTLRTLFRDS